jgi:hypothetical protein
MAQRAKRKGKEKKTHILRLPDGCGVIQHDAWGKSKK